MHPFILDAQISTSHSAQETLSSTSVMNVLRDAQNIMPFSVLIVGGQEMPELFTELTNFHGQEQPEVYLWYNLLSDYPGQSINESIVNIRGENSKSWQGWNVEGTSEVSESFLFSCPNNTDTRNKTLAGLEYLLNTYSFDGVFLDKFRFPSPASGLDMVFSCFCPYCQQKAKSQGLDLGKVKKQLENWSSAGRPESGSGKNWLDALVGDKPLLQQFLSFRCESITQLVKDVRQLTNRMNRRLALDLFTPLLAPLVGQDYAALSKLADWAKPMVYRYAYGPAGFRLEVKSLVDDLQNNYHLPLESILDWAGHYYPGVTSQAYSNMSENATPLEWIRHEIQQAVHDLQPIPILMGLESVTFPGVIEIKPSMVQEMLKTGLECNVQGAVLSWDLMHTPLENIKAIRNSL